MSTLANSVAYLILGEMKAWKKNEHDAKKRQTELLSMAANIIAFFKDHYQGDLAPTPHNVVSIILEEMLSWSAMSADLAGLSERLVRYFHIHSLQPAQLDGLPGGVAVEATHNALGRRGKVSKSALLNSTTGLILPDAQ